MLFIETPTFTRLITTLLSDDEYAGLQAELVAYPNSQKDNLTAAETAILRRLVKEL